MNKPDGASTTNLPPIGFAGRSTPTALVTSKESLAPRRRGLIMGSMLCAVIALVPAPAKGSTLPPLESFFAESDRFAERLSPDGDRVAFLGPDQHGINCLWVVATEQPNTPARVSLVEGSPVAAFFWISRDGLLWQTMDEGRARLFFAGSPAATPREILPDEMRDIRLEGVVNSSEPCVLLGLSEGSVAFPDLYRVKLGAGDRPELACVNRHRIITWAWDNAGTPVAGLRWSDGGAKEILNLRNEHHPVVFRAEPADDARLLWATAGGTKVMILTNRDGNLTRVERVELASGAREEVATDLLGRVDIDQVVADPARGKILATACTDETIRWQASDRDFGEMLAVVGRLPIKTGVACSGFDTARRQFLLRLISDRDPGTVCIYHTETRSLRTMWRERPEIDRDALSETKAFDYPARDGSRIPSYLTVPRGRKPPWPLVVFPHGGPRMRTGPGFDGRVQFLASRGYAVLQPNFRGSRGYGKVFMNAGDGQWGKGLMQTDVTDGVDYLVRTGMAHPERVAILGGSYGGYAALAGLAFTPDHYAAGICLFGMSDLLSYAGHSPVEWRAYAGDTVRRLGDPRTAAGRAALNDLSPVNHAAAIKAPLLIYHGARDPLIPADHARRMVGAMEQSGKPVDYLLAGDEAHGFSLPESEMAVYRAIELFLHEHLGGLAGPAPAEPVARRLAGFGEAGRSSPRR